MEDCMIEQPPCSFDEPLDQNNNPYWVTPHGVFVDANVEIVQDAGWPSRTLSAALEFNRRAQAHIGIRGSWRLAATADELYALLDRPSGAPSDPAEMECPF